MSITNLSSFFFHQIREAEQEADRVYEPVIGVVTDNKDPDKLMRVKVKFPSLSAQDTTFWVPVVSMGAGKERGWFFLPEVDDEVLVGFEHGDFNRPLVLGALWNGKDKAPKDNGSGSNPIRTLVSKAGSKIEFDDEKNTITVADGGGKGEIVFKADDNKMLITAKSGDVVILCPSGELKIVADGGIEMTASVGLDVRGQDKTNITGSGGVTMKASGMTSVMGGKTDINPGGVSEAAEASTSPAETADPIAG
jgi:uncharacterized protein involved in type VI secretion and phage assembly